MAWTTPRTWVAGELVTSAIGNVHWRDNFNAILANATTLNATITGSSLTGVGTITSGVWNAGAVTSSGVALFNGVGTNDFNGSTNGDMALQIRNTNTAGAAGRSYLAATAGSTTFYAKALNQAYTTSGVEFQSGVSLETGGAGGMSIAATHASGPIRFYSGGSTEVGRWHTDGDFYTVAETDYYASSTIVGWSDLTAGRRYILYKKIGKKIFVRFFLEGTSNATSASFTLPYPCSEYYMSIPIWSYNNGAYVGSGSNVWGRMLSGSSTVVIYLDNGNNFTASGVKIVSGQFTYQ